MVFGSAMTWRTSEVFEKAKKLYAYLTYFTGDNG
jgi:hypothetical protein